jgi:protease-4
VKVILSRIGTLVALAGVLFGTLALGGCINIPLNARKPLNYYDLAGQGDAIVYLMRIDGIITSETSVRGVITGESIPGTVEQVRFQLDRIEADGVPLRGLIVRINSPGGTVTASDIIHHELLAFKQRHRVPVVVLMMDVAASGGYYVAMAGDSLVAHPTTTTGSLGVIVPGLNVAALMEQYGLEDTSIASGPMKDLLSMTRPVRADHVAVVQSVVDDLHQRFIKVIQDGRGNRLKAPVRNLADGRIYTANQALAAGLVDKVGYFDEAVAEMRRLTGLHQFRIVTLSVEPEQGEANLYMAQPNRTRAQGSPVAGLLGLEQGQMAPFYYLWIP